MFWGKGLRRFMSFSVFALAAVQAARPGLQPSAAAMTAETWGRTCRDITGTFNDDELLREFGVKSWWDMFRKKRCFCERYTPYPSKECGEVEEVKDDNGHPWQGFGLGAAGPGCRCLTSFEKAKERSELVAAAAVRFCAAVVEETAKARKRLHYDESKYQNFVKMGLKVTPQLCQEILTGTLGNFSTSSQTKEVFQEANDLSKHAGTKGWGHLDPLVKDVFPSPTDYEILLHHVCTDECHEIVKETLENIEKMALDVDNDAKPSEETCADRVVRQVEAEVLGCCGRSCGWNNKSCGSWPFLTKAEKVDWMQQCCSEYNVLQGSTRERMCNSILSPQQVLLVSKLDTKAKKGDVGGAYIGQDPRLLWAKAGLDNFRQQLEKMKQTPKENEPVGSDFFEKNPDVRKEGLDKGWFHEEKDPEELAASLAQLGPSTCEVSVQNMKRNHKHCSQETWRTVKETCFQKGEWLISAKPNPNDDDLDGPPECQLKMIQPDLNTPKAVATPEECLKVDFPQVTGQVVKRRFFLYDQSNPPEGQLFLENPILCFQEKDRCPDEDDFKREDLNDFELFNDFGQYIYWAKKA